MRIDHDAGNGIWELRWDKLLLRLRLVDGLLACDHFGPAQLVADTPAFSAEESFTRLYQRPALRARTEASVQLMPDDRPVSWSLADWSQPTSTSCEIALSAADEPLRATVRFTVDEETGILGRETTLRHAGQGASVDISAAGSVAAVVPGDVQDVVHLPGSWTAEAQQERVPLSRAPLLLESQAGKTGFDHAPYVALLAPDWTYLCEISWSGNWLLHVRRLDNGRVAVFGGLNPWGLRHRLGPGEALRLPDALLACVPGDLNAATHRLHDYRRPRRPDRRHIPVQFNSWYPYQGDPSVDKTKALATAAAELGCEVFVLDAGWYTTEREDPEEQWWSRTGDWVADRRLFPDGLEELSRHCQDLGLGFGVWFEPEAVSRNALIRRDHPEWLHCIRGQPPSPGQRAILHLGVPPARDYVRERILSVLRATAAVWMKWDFNTNLHQGGWHEGLPEAITGKDPLVAHYEGLYQLQDELRAALPNLVLEMCAGGGGRSDSAILSHAHTSWMSDQTRPLVNLAVHFGSHLARCAIECNDWLVEWPPHSALPHQREVDERGDLPFRTRVAMLGTFGISAPTGAWTSEDYAIVREHVKLYKDVARPLIHSGDQYLLTAAPPLTGDGDWAAVWYVAKDADEGVLFAFRLASEQSRRSFALPGLSPDAQYLVTTMQGRRDTYQGAELAMGLAVHCETPFSSDLLTVRRT
jgi:alpha-galactosidase